MVLGFIEYVVEYVVLFKVKDDVDLVEKKVMLDVLYEFCSLNGVLEFIVGLVFLVIDKEFLGLVIGYGN